MQVYQVFKRSHNVLAQVVAGRLKIHAVSLLDCGLAPNFDPAAPFFVLSLHLTCINSGLYTVLYGSLFSRYAELHLGGPHHS